MHALNLLTFPTSPTFDPFLYDDVTTRFLAASKRLQNSPNVIAYPFPFEAPVDDAAHSVLYSHLTVFHSRKNQSPFKNVVLLWASRHGNEYASSYANIAFLEAGEELAKRYPNTTFAVFSTVNPWGLKIGSRLDETGRNPARTYFYGHQPRHGDYKPFPGAPPRIRPPPTPNVYERFNHLIVSPHVESWDYTKLSAKQLALFARYYWTNRRDFTAGVTDPKYIWHPNYFGPALTDDGGVARCRARRVDEMLMNTMFANTKNMIIIDPHSGEGKSGRTDLMISPHLTAEEKAHAKDIFQGFHIEELGKDFKSLGDPINFPWYMPKKPTNLITLAAETGASFPFWVFRAQTFSSSVLLYARDNDVLMREAGQRMRQTHTWDTPEWKQGCMWDLLRVYELAASAVDCGMNRATARGGLHQPFVFQKIYGLS